MPAPQPMTPVTGTGGGGLGPVQAPLRAPTAPKAYFRLGSHDRPRRHAGASPPANQRSALRSHSLPPPGDLRPLAPGGDPPRWRCPGSAAAGRSGVSDPDPDPVPPPA